MTIELNLNANWSNPTGPKVNNPSKPFMTVRGLELVTIRLNPNASLGIVGLISRGPKVKNQVNP